MIPSYLSCESKHTRPHSDHLKEQLRRPVLGVEAPPRQTPLHCHTFVLHILTSNSSCAGPYLALRPATTSPARPGSTVTRSRSPA